jgi:hypothetical protein
MDDLIGEALLYFFGPVILVLVVVALIVGGCQKISETISPKPIIENVQPVEDKTLSEKAGKKTKELAKDFVKGFFSE